MEKKVGVFTELVLLALFFVSIQVQADSDESSWNKATATFYGGSDASGTMGKTNNLCILFSFLIT